jgi:hypothetical protein
MKKILIISFSDLKKDPRVFRQIDHLRKDFHVTTVGWESPELEGVEFYRISPVNRSGLDRIKRAFAYKFHWFEPLYWSLYDFQPLLARFSQKRYDLIIANDIETLPFTLRIANHTRILLDLHEYAPRQFEDQFTWRFFFQAFNKYLCTAYLKQADEIITINTGIANEYKKNYGIEAHIITNAADYADLQPTPVKKENIRIIGHGLANPSRRWELMIRIMENMDRRFHLDLMLLPLDPRYYRSLERMAGKRENVSIIPPVKRDEIIPATNTYDLSFLIFKPYSLNYRYMLGNKFFESLQARLAIVTASATVQQAEIVTRYGCGVVLDRFEPNKIAMQLNRLTPQQIEEYKKKAHLAAGELTSQKNMEKLAEIVKRLVYHD